MLRLPMRYTDYTNLAATYDRRYQEEDYTDIENALIEFVGDVRTRVLEVGCGTGHWLEMLAARGVGAVGVDPSWPMLSRATSKIPSRSIAQGRAEALPFTSGCFHRVFCINAHHHFSDKRSFLKETRRVLTPGGSLMMVALDPHNGADQWWVYDYFEGTLEIDKQRYPSCAEVRAWMAALSFGDVHTREVQRLPDDTAAVEALEGGMVTRSYTSQLAVLTDDEFDAGVARLRNALASGPQLRLKADLRVFATYGVKTAE